jgi:hypothetical protein
MKNDDKPAKHFIQVGTQLVPASRKIARYNLSRRNHKYTNGSIKGANKPHVFKPLYDPRLSNSKRMIIRREARQSIKELEATL